MKKVFTILIMLIISVGAWGQSREYSGKVTVRGTEIPVEGAEVTTKGAIKFKTSTNREGVFFIPASEGDFTVTLFLKGYIKQSKKVEASQSEGSYTLEPSTSLEDASKAKNSDSRSNIALDDSKSGMMTKDAILKRLQTIPGVSVVGDRITIRGASSVNSSNQPVFYVDGVRSEGLDGVDPSSIIKLEVLKGSAASIYGVAGSAGVILVTTRSR